MIPTSCDTFVCLPPNTKNGVIFGKNSDRPSEEIQEVVYYPKKNYDEKSKVKCTYIEIPQVCETAGVILSKPNWMWGAEMGSNEYGVCIGNEAVWGKLEATEEKKLLGMDFVRLGLERGKTAKDALDVITTLLEIHGQGGPCSHEDDGFTYHNSYIITDASEAWVLETIDRFWAAERVETGYRNISNSLSIGTKIDAMSTGLKEEAEKLGFWKPGSDFNFSRVFSRGSSDSRFHNGKKLLQKYSANNCFGVEDMMNILRDEKSGINMGGYEGGFASTASQVSILQKSNGIDNLSSHWFTATPDPLLSIFKPFIFVQGISPTITMLTSSSPCDSSSNGNCKHPLYKIHEGVYFTKIRKDPKIRKAMAELENALLNQVEGGMSNSEDAVNKSKIFCDTFKNGVEAEIELYK